jgi:hypothetical protein
MKLLKFEINKTKQKEEGRIKKLIMIYVRPGSRKG